MSVNPEAILQDVERALQPSSERSRLNNVKYTPLLSPVAERQLRDLALLMGTTSYSRILEQAIRLLAEQEARV